MGWIDASDKLPPEGLNVLVEASGYGRGTHGENIVADHDFFLGTWLHPVGEDEGEWFIDSETHYYSTKVHAWMPLPKHYQQKERDEDPEEDMMEHALFEDDPDWLYKGEAVYEQMTLDEFLKGAEQ